MVMEEYTSLKKNKTWVPTTLLNGRFVVGRKWVFKVKLESNDCIDHFEAHLVAKGYSQVGHGCIDYEENISLAKITSIRALMTIVVERDLELHQMDVKTVFLNIYLKENIYMQQLKSYVKLGREDLACKL
jgi:DNA polymerase zeta